MACGSGGSNIRITNQAAPSITGEPGNQSTRVGQTATFAVTAAGTGPLSYQWSRNQTTIPGANSASYTTPSAVATDNGAVFTVTVTNSVGSVSSSPATLTVGPRAPAPGDIRFQQVAAASTLPGLIPGGIHSVVFAGLGQFFGNAVGTPLTMGANCNSGSGSALNCAWAFSTFPLPTGVTGLTTNYQGFDSKVFPPNSQLQSLVDGHNVFTSLDLELDNDCYSASWIESSSSGGFIFAQQSIDPTQLQAVATALGGQGSVITAISFDASGNAFFTSFTWTSDTSTIFEVKTATATLDTIAAQATALGNAGYIITAFGGNPTNGFLLVGTRVQGDTMPRPILIVTPKTGTDLDPLLQSGDSIVGYITNADLSNTYIGEQ
ncbi:MAG TPA: hypothetical protein VKV39_09145 [Candidatus Sulfotelmatobacter sp.]|nr:hypothetical protein [Candidatus Sulfotelmatobacter sp.]